MMCLLIGLQIADSIRRTRLDWTRFDSLTHSHSRSLTQTGAEA
jgi:hypothetical protein